MTPKAVMMTVPMARVSGESSHRAGRMHSRVWYHDQPLA
eukprot:CAMPEP_0119315234 /NCGR_PEP_ID=MMETSP1333-20130426/34921_1 /TAXON_ID=418940 /ORGANISM="Scyphosphaera apsteinii, Strain RCC1455" /LENGTH=38 /DNA_ID= /DNA_START= /DNA_END= /DNA_ORIENTATION=